MYSEIFDDIFYKTPIKLFKKISDGSYSNEAEEKFIKTIYCDLQSVDAGIIQLPYGLYENITLKMYCSTDEDIKTGDYIKTDDGEFIIEAVLKWKAGYKLLLSRRDI